MNDTEIWLMREGKPISEPRDTDDPGAARAAVSHAAAADTALTYIFSHICSLLTLL